MRLIKINEKCQNKKILITGTAGLLKFLNLLPKYEIIVDNFNKNYELKIKN